jgi:hypothetical protein
MREWRYKVHFVGDTTHSVLVESSLKGFAEHFAEIAEGSRRNVPNIFIHFYRHY